jgi:hypothetical protein
VGAKKNHGLKLVEMPKRKIVEETKPADLLKEVLERADKIDQLLILAKHTNGGISWISNLQDDAGAIYFMERMKHEIIQGHIEKDIDEVPPCPA